MEEKRGLFVVFEGIDGSGKSTQVNLLIKYIEELDKYIDILKTHEPWKSEKIKKRLEEDKNAYSGAEELAKLFVDYRIKHSTELIKPNLDIGVHVLCDRYSLSTCAYQSCQGVDLNKLIDMHCDKRILRPDITFVLDIPAVCAIKRVSCKRRLEKFEKDSDFVRELVNTYRKLAYDSSLKNILGNIQAINGESSIGEVSKDIQNYFLKVYKDWKEKS